MTKTERMDTISADNRAREHRRLAHECFIAAQTPGIAALPRVTLTVESVYLCALAALGAAVDHYKHPSREALVTGARLAGLSKEEIDPIADCLEYRYEPACSDARWQVPLDLLTKAAKTMLEPNETMNFSAVQQFFKPLTDDQVRVLARKHAGTPGIEQSIYLDEVGLQSLAVEVLKAQRSSYKSALEREHLSSLEAVSKAFAHIDISEYTDMTEPHQRTRALLKTMRFLDELTRPGDTPRVPRHIRDTARRLLRDYPGFEEIEAAHKVLPDVFGPVMQRQAEGMPAQGKRGKSGD